ncbi:NAD-dependent epimerase/dehydratase family protein [Falsiroseomonas ponticola]|uniref:NAD-dependent epimerase/dehydratase family protein n=1 Tax=Falsiroseomonas ponticola TaxID=2786951 RepID=UPI00193211A6|nr:NAD(P)-dependent oxidoreductase [Roseomonas ponticola]
MAERLLLTGAGGFVGRALAAPLAARGFAVHAVAGRLRANLLDESDQAALLREVKPAVIVHAAWYVVHGRFWTAPENADWLEASTALARRFAEGGGRRFIGIGSCAEYATEPEAARWPESRAIAPATPYGIAKAALAARLAALEGLSTAWARLFHLFGPGEHPDRLVPAVIAALREGREARCASGRPIRDFASTGFAARGIAALAASAVTGPVNIGAGEGRSIRDLVETLARLAGRPDLPRFGALPDRPGEVPVMVADTTRLRREVGFTEAAGTDAALACAWRGD